MRNIELTNVPDDLYQRMEDLAKVRRLPIGEIASDYLIKGLAAEDREEEQLMTEIRADRERLAQRGVFVTDEDIRRGRVWGRP